MRPTTTWMKELSRTRGKADDTEGPVTLAPDLDAFVVEFDPGYGTSEGPTVLAWTETRVYFPVVYDGAEWMGSAPRNPQQDGQHHVGGQ